MHGLQLQSEVVNNVGDNKAMVFLVDVDHPEFQMSIYIHTLHTFISNIRATKASYNVHNNSSIKVGKTILQIIKLKLLK